MIRRTYVGFRKVKPTSIKDLAGLKVGFGSTVNKAWAEKLGMTFVQIPLQEGYNALEKGVVDAYTGTVGDHLNYAYCEAESYHRRSSHLRQQWVYHHEPENLE